ncbi:MAG: histidine phosphatase family protein [Acidobacteriota bacterium]
MTSLLQNDGPHRVPRELLLVRHGQTEWNMRGRLQGQLDSPLTERGLAQARAAGELLASRLDGSGSEVVASPLGRAYRTAEIVAEALSAPGVRSDDRLKEVSFGDFEGLTEDQLLERFPKHSARRLSDKWNFVHPEGESFAGTALRIASFLEANASAERLVVVAHSGIGRVIRGLYHPRPEQELAYLGHPQNEIYRLRCGEPEETIVTSAPI